MKIQKINFKDHQKKYSILLGNNILKILSKEVKIHCPQTKKIALIFDKGVPSKYRKIITNNTQHSKITNRAT